MTAIIFGGTVSATYAWFQLNQDKQIQVSGTSFGKSEDLTIGFVSDAKLDHDGLIYDEDASTEEDKNIYWAGDEQISSDLVKYIVQANGYSDGDIYPLTSAEHSADSDDFFLYESPALGCSFESLKREADKNFYIHISFAFKLSGGSGSTSSAPVKNGKVYMSDYQLSGSAKSAVRVHVSSDSVTSGSVSSIINPTASTDGYTLVGGPLDLDQDGEYDHYVDQTTKEYKEFFYGQNRSDPIYSSAYTDTVYDSRPNLDCFTNPNHTKGVIPLADSGSYASRAYYSSLQNYLYLGEGADNSSIVPMCVTDSNGIGFMDLDIYLEGWDKTLINQVIGSTIGTSISFIGDGGSE